MNKKTGAKYANIPFLLLAKLEKKLKKKAFISKKFGPKIKKKLGHTKTE